MKDFIGNCLLNYVNIKTIPKIFEIYYNIYRPLYLINYKKLM